MEYTISTEQPNIHLESYIADDDLMFLTATEGNACKGVLGFEILEDIMRIRYIYVVEAFRQNGIATEMVKQACNYGRENKLQGIVWTVSVEQEMQSSATRFLIRNGFHIPSYEESTVTVQLDSLKNSYLANLPMKTDGMELHLYRMDQLPFELKSDYELYIKPNIREACHVSEVRGRLIKDLSFALERDGKIMSYALFSDLEGELYLNAVYVNAKNATYLIKLLKYCLENVKQHFRQYKTMKVTLINQEGNHLFGTLIKGAETKSEIVIMTFKTL